MQAEVQGHGEQRYGCIDGISLSVERRMKIQLLEEGNSLCLIVHMPRGITLNTAQLLHTRFRYPSGVGHSNLPLSYDRREFALLSRTVTRTLLRAGPMTQ